MKTVFEIFMVVFSVTCFFLFCFSVMSFFSNNPEDAIYLMMCSLLSWRIATWWNEQLENDDG